MIVEACCNSEKQPGARGTCGAGDLGTSTTLSNEKLKEPMLSQAPTLVHHPHRLINFVDDSRVSKSIQAIKSNVSHSSVFHRALDPIGPDNFHRRRKGTGDEVGKGQAARREQQLHGGTAPSLGADNPTGY